LSFCHYTLNDTSLETLIPYLKKRQIGVINGAPTSMALLTQQGAPPWHPASEAVKAGARRAVEFCKQRGINIVELAIQFSIANPDIATTLVGTASSREMRDNIQYAQKPLDHEKLQQVLDVLKPIHNFNFTRGLEENRDEIKN
jgi:L-galactose dehydrogenase